MYHKSASINAFQFCCTCEWFMIFSDEAYFYLTLPNNSKKFKKKPKVDRYFNPRIWYPAGNLIFLGTSARIDAYTPEVTARFSHANPFKFQISEQRCVCVFACLIWLIREGQTFFIFFSIFMNGLYEKLALFFFLL
jgi:hypothetical protein